MGSLLAATASYLDAHARGGQWLLRIDDIDTYRCIPGAAAQILRTLEAHGLSWDGSVQYQSENLAEYQAALDLLGQRREVFYCNCSRRSLAARGAYPGKCRGNLHHLEDAAVRIRVDGAVVKFTDLLQGKQIEHLAESVGDFIIRRRDGLIAYQLATAIDDGNPRISHVVRGSDLLGNTARQLYLMQQLKLSAPVYAHIPTLIRADGHKLSKQNHAPAVADEQALENLLAAFGYLGLRPPTRATHWDVTSLLDWGCEHWSLNVLQGQTSVCVD
jgi:glutamyl-Q tRNA(Asp) synthetase